MWGGGKGQICGKALVSSVILSPVFHIKVSGWHYELFITILNEMVDRRLNNVLWASQSCMKLTLNAPTLLNVTGEDKVLHDWQ